MKFEDIVIVDMENNIVEGIMCLLLDIKMYMYLYCVFDNIGGVIYIYLIYVMVWVQVKQSILCLGIIYVDYVYGDIICICELIDEQVNGDYEEEIGV